MFDASRIVNVADRFALKQGGELAEVQLACETWGSAMPRIPTPSFCLSDCHPVLTFVPR